MRTAVVVLLFLVTASYAGAQTPERGSNTTVLGYAVAGTGWVEDLGLLSFGGGFEALFKGVGVGAEIMMLGPSGGFTDEYLGAFSLNGVYHFASSGERARRLSPFVTGGYTLYFRNGSENLWNIGGGVDYWLSRRVGIRGEVRDQFYLAPCSSCGATHLWNIRGGVVIR